MKRICSMILTLSLLLGLCACGEQSAGSPTVDSTPLSTVSPSPEPTPPEPSPTPDATLPPVADDSTRYFFSDAFLGSWSAGQWHSAAEEAFTVGELFNRNYYDVWGETVGAVRFYISEGPGGFDDPGPLPALLDPFGIIEGDYFVMKLPGQLTGEAAAITVPNYGFTAFFDGQLHALTANLPLERPDMWWTEPQLSEAELTEALESVEIDYANPTRADRTAWQCDIDGDGKPEYLELIQTPRDWDGFTLLEPGDPCFYAFLLCDEGGPTVMVSRSIPYTTDVTAHFTAGAVYLADLDGDGNCELLFSDGEWEGGSANAYSLVDGEWTLVLQGLYGS